MDEESSARVISGSPLSPEPAPSDDHPGTPSTVRNALVAGAMFVGRAVLAFVTAALVAKYLGAAGRGQVVFVSNLAGLLALAAGSGTATGINRLHSVDGVASSKLVAASTIVGIVAGVAVCGILVAVNAAVDVGSVRETGLPGSAWALLGVSLVALIVFANLSQVASLDNRLGAVTITALIGVAFYIVWTVVTAVAGSISVLNNLVGWSISSIIPTALLLAAMHAPRSATDETDTVAGVIRRLAVISVRANFAALAILAIWRIDVLLVESRRGFRELGLYSVAVALAEIVVVLAMALRSAMLPHHGGDDDELAGIIVQSTRVALVITTVLGLALAAVGPILLVLMFGDEYRQTYPALVLLLPGTIFLVLHYPLFDYIAARSRLSALTTLGLIGLAFNIGVNYWALGRWSYVAAAVVSSITYLVIFTGCVTLFVRHSGRTVRETLVVRRSDLAGLAALARRRRAPSLAEGDEDVAGRKQT